jgi:hypothetical protein
VEQAHDLRDTEDEHEVEKELDERDFLIGGRGYFLRHLGTIRSGTANTDGADATEHHRYYFGENLDTLAVSVELQNAVDVSRFSPMQ